MSHRPSLAWFVALACCLLTSCALLSKAEPLVPRYFTPEDGSGAEAQRPTAQAGASVPMRLRLGNVRGGSQLRERIMFRDSDHELGYYEDRRWTERPEAYLRRAIARMLFEERGLVRVVSGAVTTLDLELVAFEEIRAPKHMVRVQVIVSLDNDRIGSTQETITVERPTRSDAKDDDADAAVTALAVALDDCVAQIADRVMAKLASTPDVKTEAPVSQQ